jgi:hypothetical protein
MLNELPKYNIPIFEQSDHTLAFCLVNTHTLQKLDRLQHFTIEIQLPHLTTTTATTTTTTTTDTQI